MTLYAVSIGLAVAGCYFCRGRPMRMSSCTSGQNREHPLATCLMSCRHGHSRADKVSLFQARLSTFNVWLIMHYVNYLPYFHNFLQGHSGLLHILNVFLSILT